MKKSALKTTKRVPCRDWPCKKAGSRGVNCLFQRFTDPLPTAKTDLPNNTIPSIYPRLPEVSQPAFPWSASTPIKPESKPVSRDESRFDRLRRIVKLCNFNEDGKEQVDGTIDLEQLKKDCWLGIPNNIRPMAWRLLSGYIPVNMDRQKQAVERKRNEYWQFVEQYFHTRYDEQHQDTFRQIHIDIPRMCPLIPLFQQKMVQEVGFNNKFLFTALLDI
jgi:hypothetical protein